MDAVIVSGMGAGSNEPMRFNFKPLLSVSGTNGISGDFRLREWSGATKTSTLGSKEGCDYLKVKPTEGKWNRMINEDQSWSYHLGTGT